MPPAPQPPSFAARLTHPRRAAALACVAWLAAAGCAPPSRAPTAEDTAAYLGLAAGAAWTFDVGGGATETLSVQESSVLVADALVFDVVARGGNGFGVPERTLSIAAGPQGAQIARFSDCVTSCRQPASPVEFVKVPLAAGRSAETEVDVTVTDNTGEERAVSERHVFVVAAAAPLETPAGPFDAHAVSWSRVVDGESANAVIYLAPDTGIVGWDGFDGAALRLAP